MSKDHLKQLEDNLKQAQEALASYKNVLRIPSKQYELFTDSTGLEWEVLFVDGGKAVISPRQPTGERVCYNKNNKWSEYVDSDLRNAQEKWFENELCPKIKDVALEVDVDNRAYAIPKVGTGVKVFALSLDEYRKYYHGLDLWHRFDKWFWLRSAGDFGNAVSIVGNGGIWSTGGTDNMSSNFSFRPAIWVNLKIKI